MTEGRGGGASHPLLEQALAAAADPVRARAGLERVLECDPAPAEVIEGLLAAGAMQRALALLGLGGAPIEALMAEPRELLLLGEPLDDARVAAAAADPGATLDDLRALRRRTTLCVAARELAGELGAPQAALHLSRAADALIEAALRLARVQAARRFPRAAALHLAVLALGKLGGSELNYSSDVDLVLVRRDGEPEDAAVALGRALVGAVQEASAQGRLYRVDLRLRPYGASGALVPAAGALVDSYAEHGRTWERQAWIKARVCAGDAGLGQEVLARLAPWLWREALDAGAIREIVGLRDRMTLRASSAAGASTGGERDVKVGRGGLRDVEFAAQFLQLLHGGRDPELRATGTLEGLRRLAAARVLSPDEAAELGESYRFVRRLEHLLQLLYDRELTRLPEGAALEPLARALCLEPAALEARFAARREAARRILDRLLRAPFAADEAPAAPAAAVQDLLLLGQPPPPERAAALLAGYGFVDPASAWRLLDALARERSSFLAPSGRARTLLAGLAPRLLTALARCPQPDRALTNLERATSNLGAKATVYELMTREPDALGLFVNLAAGSDVLTETLTMHPGVLDEVIDRLRTRTASSADEVQAEAAAILAAAPDPEAAEGPLRELRALHLLLAGMLDLGGRANVQNTGRALAGAAEGFLRAFLARAQDEAARRHGGLPAGGLCLLAVGKLGAHELSYGSDLDLIAVSAGSGRSGAAEHADAAQVWGEVVQALVEWAGGRPSAEGPFLPIDLRLRPDGSKGPLVAEEAAALAYWRGEGARHFERLALQKARAVAGDAALGARLERSLAEALYDRPYGADLWDEVETMRARQVEASRPGDLKRGPGSLADVELLASGLALAHGGRIPALRTGNTVRLLGALEQAGLLRPAEHRDLRTAYALLRRLELRLRVRTFQGRPLLPADEVGRRHLALSLGYVDVDHVRAEAAFAEEVAFHRRRAREVVASVIARERARGGAR